MIVYRQILRISQHDFVRVPPIQERFGRRVRELREQAGLSQDALAAKSQISRPYLAEIETGRRNPSLTIVEAIAKGLKVSIVDLLNF